MIIILKPELQRILLVLLQEIQRVDRLRALLPYFHNEKLRIERQFFFFGWVRGDHREHGMNSKQLVIVIYRQKLRLGILILPLAQSGLCLSRSPSDSWNSRSFRWPGRSRFRIKFWFGHFASLGRFTLSHGWFGVLGSLALLGLPFLIFPCFFIVLVVPAWLDVHEDVDG